MVDAWHTVGTPSPAEATAADAAVGVTVVTRLTYRRDGHGYLGHCYHQIWIVDVETAAAFQLTAGLTDSYAPVWSPDGDRIACVSNRADDWAVDYRSALWVISSSGGAAVRVTPEEGVAFAPAWSPDGRYLAYSGLPAAMAYGSNHQLLLASPEGEYAPRLLVGAATFKGHIGGCLLSDTWQTGAGALHLHWTPDSSAIFFVAAHRARAHVFMADLEGGISRLVAGERACAMLSISRDGRTLAFGAADLLHPAEQYHNEGQALRTETTSNDPADFRLGKRLSALPALRACGFAANRRLLDVECLSQDCASGAQAVELVSRPPVVAGQRVAALPLFQPCVQALFAALVLFALTPAGFANKDLRPLLAQLLGLAPSQISPGQLTYHLRRLRLHGLITRLPHSQRYQVTADGLRLALFCTRLHTRVLCPGLAATRPEIATTDTTLRPAFDRLDRALDQFFAQARLVA